MKRSRGALRCYRSTFENKETLVSVRAVGTVRGVAQLEDTLNDQLVGRACSSSSGGGDSGSDSGSSSSSDSGAAVRIWTARAK